MSPNILSLKSLLGLYSEPVPDDLVRDGQIISYEAMSDFLKEVFKKHRITEKRCSVIIADELVYVRYISMPYMKPEQLKINLPYEFHDFISEDKNKYVFDYAFINVKEGGDDSAGELELMAAAAKKSVIADYAESLKHAGLKLAAAVPYVMTYSNIIREAESRITEVENNGVVREYCFVDIGHTSCRINIFVGRKLVATRVIEYGLNMLDSAIAEAEGVDIHIARTRKESDFNGVLSSETCVNVYNAIAIDIMRPVNVYRCNKQESLLAEAFICGGGGKIAPLMDVISANTDLAVIPVESLTDCPKEFIKDAELFTCAIGAARQ